MIIEGLHLLCTDLMNAAAPVTCGQAIDVPDFMPNWEGFCPGGTLPGSVLLGIIAARMPTPGTISLAVFLGGDTLRSKLNAAIRKPRGEGSL